MSEFSIVEITFAIFALFIGGLIIFVIIFGHKPTSKSFWDDLIKFAIKNNASNLLIEAGKPPQMKIEDKWHPIGLPIDTEEFNHLELILQSQSGVRIIRGVGIAHVVRDEENAIEWELKPGQYY